MASSAGTNVNPAASENTIPIANAGPEVLKIPISANIIAMKPTKIVPALLVIVGLTLLLDQIGALKRWGPILAVAMAVGIVITPVATKSTKLKYTTPIPEGVMTPDTLKTGRGTLRFVDGVPTEQTAQMVWDQLDFGRAVECMIMCTPAASLNGFRRSIREWGPDNETMIIWEGRMDSKVLMLSTLYSRHAQLGVDALGSIGIPARVLPDADALLHELVVKNVYILTTNIAGLKVGGNVGQLWDEHNDTARAVAADVIRLQEALTGSRFNNDELVGLWDRMEQSFAAIIEEVTL